MGTNKIFQISEDGEGLKCTSVHDLNIGSAKANFSYDDKRVAYNKWGDYIGANGNRFFAENRLHLLNMDTKVETLVAAPGEHVLSYAFRPVEREREVGPWYRLQRPE